MKEVDKSSTYGRMFDILRKGVQLPKMGVVDTENGSASTASPR